MTVGWASAYSAFWSAPRSFGYHRKGSAATYRGGPHRCELAFLLFARIIPHIHFNTCSNTCLPQVLHISAGDCQTGLRMTGGLQIAKLTEGWAAFTGPAITSFVQPRISGDDTGIAAGIQGTEAHMQGVRACMGMGARITSRAPKSLPAACGSHAGRL